MAGTPRPPRIADSADALVAGAISRIVVDPDDGKSGSTFERVQIGGERYFLKTVSYPRDWIMRVTGDRDQRTFRIWEAGVMDAAPPCIDHAVVGMALDGVGRDAELSVLMHDLGEHLIPEGDAVVSAATHRGLLDDMAAMAAAYWGWEDELGLTTMEDRLRFFALETLAPELEVADPPDVVAAADVGWSRLAERAPDLFVFARETHHDPRPLAAALRSTPATFLHGDWKMGNLGRHPDGRTILLDWAYPGAGPICWDLAWYLALNRPRLPEPKDAAIDAFRAALERHGVDTEPWWDAQLGLSLAAIMVTFGWEKALGDDAELAWWRERALAGASLLDAPA